MSIVRFSPQTKCGRVGNLFPCTVGCDGKVQTSDPSQEVRCAVNGGPLKGRRVRSHNCINSRREASDNARAERLSTMNGNAHSTGSGKGELFPRERRRVCDQFRLTTCREFMSASGDCLGRSLFGTRRTRDQVEVRCRGLFCLLWFGGCDTSSASASSAEPRIDPRRRVPLKRSPHRVWALTDVETLDACGGFRRVASFRGKVHS
jgi:hypothetical protein